MLLRCYRQYKREKVIIKKGSESEHKGWWKSAMTSVMEDEHKEKNSEAIGRCVPLKLKRTIELEID